MDKRIEDMYKFLREEYSIAIEEWKWCIKYEKDCDNCPHYSAEDEVCNFDK